MQIDGRSASLRFKSMSNCDEPFICLDRQGETSELRDTEREIVKRMTICGAVEQ